LDANQIMLGKYSLPFILSIVLGLLYKKTSVADDWKPIISAGAGVALGVAAMFYNVADYATIDFPTVADYALSGAVAGWAAVGIYETTKESGAGRTYIPIDANNKRIPGAKVAKVSKIKIMGGGPLT